MTNSEAIAQLNAIAIKDGDKEIAHQLRDRIVLEFLRTVDPKVATAAENVENTVGFWYA